MTTEAFEKGRGYTRADWDAVSDNPELTDEELAEARPLKEANPRLYAAITEAIDGGTGKESGALRLDEDVVRKFRATGEGWQARANEVLRRAKI